MKFLIIVKRIQKAIENLELIETSLSHILIEVLSEIYNRENLNTVC